MKKQANSLHCFVCGVENDGGLHLNFYEPQPGQVRAEITVPETFQGYPGVVHGGVVAAMLDEAAGRTWMGAEEPRFMVTARLSIRYRRPVPVGKPLVLVGRAGEDRGRVATATGEIYSQDGQLLAEAEVVMADIPSELTRAFGGEPDGWRVYPDEE